jgi:hypothetical protein
MTWAKVDTNQPAVVKRLREIGCTVRSTAAVGQGFADLCVGFRGQTFILEVKDGSKPPSARKLTEDEAAFMSGWAGQYAIVNSPEEAAAYILSRTNCGPEAA